MEGLAERSISIAKKGVMAVVVVEDFGVGVGWFGSAKLWGC